MTNEERQVEIERIITNLNIIAPKNPRSDWGRIQKKDIDEACNVLRKAIIVPDNATNKDMILLIFPNLKYNEDDYFNVVHIDGLGTISLDWWKAPYKK